MPLRPDAVLSELPRDVVDTILGAAVAAGWRESEWHELPWLRNFAVGVAIHRRVGRFQRAEGLGKEAAIRRTARAFGLSPSAVKLRLYRDDARRVSTRAKKVTRSNVAALPTG